MLIGELNKGSIQSLVDIISNNIIIKIDNFNNAMTTSAQYKARLESIKDEDNVILALKSVSLDLKESLKEYIEGSKEYDTICDAQYSVDGRINDRVEELVNSEFGVINRWRRNLDRFGVHGSEVIKSKISLCNVTDFNELVDSVTDWYLKELEIYI